MRHPRGFTLLEVIVAASLLAIAILGTLAAIGQGTQLSVTSSETETAAELITSLQERFQGEGRGDDWQEKVLRLAMDPMVTGTLGDGTFTDDRLPGLTGAVVILDEAEAHDAFAIDKDGTAGNDPLDLDADDIDDEVGLTWGTPGAFASGGASTGGSLPAPGGHAWNTSKATNDSDVRAMRVIPIQITISWDTVTGGGDAAQRRSLSATTIVYPKNF